MRPSPTTHTPATAAVLLAVLLLAACSGSDQSPTGPQLPQESAFAAGTCRAAAPDVLAVGRELPGLGSDKTVPREAKDALREAQARLGALAEAAEPTVKPSLDDLVVSIGLLRIRADGNEYAPSLGDAVQDAYTSVVKVCTG